MKKSALVALTLIGGSFFASNAHAARCVPTQPGPGGAPNNTYTCVSASVENVEGQDVTFQGSGYSTANFSDFSNQLRWKSDVDGTIGHGREFTANLSKGRHTITAEYSALHAYYYDKVSVVVRDKFCADEVASESDTTSSWTATRFINTNDKKVHIYWKDYSGNRHLYSVLNSDESVSLTGYPGNRWVIADEFKNCAMMHVSDYQDSTVLISFDE